MFKKFYVEDGCGAFYVEKNGLYKDDGENVECLVQNEEYLKVFITGDRIYEILTNCIVVLDYISFKELERHMFSKESYILNIVMVDKALLVVLSDGKVYKSEKGKKSLFYDFKLNSLFSACISNNTLYAGSYNTIKAFDLYSKTKLFEFNLHKGRIFDIFVDNNFIYTCGEDRKVVELYCKNKKVTTLCFDLNFYFIKVQKYKNYLILLNQEGELKVCDIATKKLKHVFVDELFTNFEIVNDKIVLEYKFRKGYTKNSIEECLTYTLNNKLTYNTTSIENKSRFTNDIIPNAIFTELLATAYKINVFDNTQILSGTNVALFFENYKLTKVLHMNEIIVVDKLIITNKCNWIFYKNTAFKVDNKNKFDMIRSIKKNTNGLELHTHENIYFMSFVEMNKKICNSHNQVEFKISAKDLQHVKYGVKHKSRINLSNVEPRKLDVTATYGNYIGDANGIFIYKKDKKVLYNDLLLGVIVNISKYQKYLVVATDTGYVYFYENVDTERIACVKIVKFNYKIHDVSENIVVLANGSVVEIELFECEVEFENNKMKDVVADEIKLKYTRKNTFNLSIDYKITVLHQFNTVVHLILKHKNILYFTVDSKLYEVNKTLTLIPLVISEKELKFFHSKKIYINSDETGIILHLDTGHVVEYDFNEKTFNLLSIKFV